MKKKPQPAQKAPTPTSQPANPPVKPLKPRPMLLLITGIAMALWIISLLVMYVTTVFPHRHG